MLQLARPRKTVIEHSSLRELKLNIGLDFVEVSESAESLGLIFNESLRFSEYVLYTLTELTYHPY